MKKKDDEIIKTTPEDFQLFKRECKKWLKKFGLIGWRVLYEHEELNNSQAQVNIKLQSRVAVITLNTKLHKIDYNKVNIKKCAFHEVLELLLGRMTILAEYRHTTSSEIEEETHNIIRTFENLVFKE